MNRIYKVIYSKVRQCYVVVSEIAKSHGRHTKSSVAKSNAALTAAVLIALGGVSFITNPEVAYADLPAANGYYLGISDADTSRTKDDNANGKGATGTDSITIGHNSTAGIGTITIGDRSAGSSIYSVYLGEHYTAANQQYPDMGKYVTSIGWGSDAKGTGSIALGSGAEADVNSALEGGEENPDAASASVAIGYQAKANQNNIAIGAKSVATDAFSTKLAAFTNQAAPKSYVSVGDGIKDSKTQYRRITNVADGAENSDVATVGQLQALAAKSGTYKAGFGIEITPDTTTKENTIKLSRNLGRDMDSTDRATLVADESKSALVLGGRVEEGQSKKGQVVEKPYGAFGQDSVVVGGANNIADKDGLAAVVVGGTTNTASAQYSTVAGGDNNDAFGNESSVFGGFDNDAFGAHATLSGGSMNRAYGEAASVFGGAMNSALGASSVAVGGLQSTVNGAFAVGIAGGSTNANHALAAGNGANVTVENGTAIGYQATTDEANTIAFGHDAGDVSGYTIKWKQRTDGKTNADHTTNDYTQVPDSVTPTTYKDAYYNRLVKVADGVDAHDAVVMEQLKPYTKSDASNIGANLKTYTVGDDGETITETNATDDQKKTNKDDWGKALGAEKFTTGTDTTATNASTSEQLVTGKTLYNYDAPVAETGKKLNYVSANNTTGQNLSALDAQVKSNAEALNDKTHNIKYYSVNDQNSISRTPKTLPTMKGLADNSDNKGAKGMGSLASGFNTEADGTLSTVGGSYSGVINEGSVPYLPPYLPPFLNVDIRGTTAVSYGTGNINKSTAQSGRTSGVANSLIGQVNDVTDSNAAIAIGAGNTISNSYRDVTINPMEVYNNSHNPEALRKLMQDAVKESGGQVMVMGGGNSVDKAYMTQVVGVGNKVTGHDTTYAEGTSTQYNYVDGFQNTLTNGKNDYIIGANNSVTGDSIDKNQSNIVVGDNHTLNNEKNNVVLGSADSSKELAASGAVVIGHNADVSVDGGVALGSDSVGSVEGGQKGYDPAATVTNKTTAPWTSTKAAVSVGKADGSITRQITGVAAGTNDTDAVNVAQIKKLASVDASNIGKNFKNGDVTTNENAWGKALGTGTVTKDDDGSKQLVTGGTVYNEVRPSKDGEYVKIAQTTGANLIALDDQVKQNAQNISDNTYTQGDGIFMDKTKKTISVNKGDGLKFNEGKLAVYTGNGLKIDNGAVAIETSDSNLKVDSNGIGLSDKITIGSGKTKQVTIDGTKGEISGLTNTTWDSKADYSKSTKAATESQVDAAVKDAVKQAGENDIHVAAGSYAVNDQNQVSMNLVGKNNDTKGTVIITDVAKSSEMGDVSKLADGVKNAGGKTTTVVDAINNVNTSMNTKIGDQKYSTSGSNKYVQDGDSITSAIGKLDGAVQQAASAAGKHSTVSEGSNIKVNGNVQNDGHTDYKVSLKDDISLNSVTTKSVTTKSATTDTLTVNNSATIGGVTIANKTISGLNDTKIEKDSKKAVNAGTIYNELRPATNGTYIKTTNTTAQNLTSLDTQVKATHDLINSDGKTIKIGGSDAATKIDVNGRDGKGRVITGVVSDASDPNSAANVGYVNGITSASNEQIYRDMNMQYNHVENDISRAAAGSNALAALHPMQEFDPDDKAQYALGYGHYRNSNAGAVGVFYQPDENSLFSLGASFGNGDAGINAGVTVKFGPGGSDHHALTKTQMAKVIDAQSKEIDALKKDNADKDKRIDALEQKVNEILAKVEKDKA